MGPGSPLSARKNAHWPEARWACCTRKICSVVSFARVTTSSDPLFSAQG